MEKPLVSVICLSYNHAQYIKECIDGVLKQQTNFPFEVIIHDDASTDETQALIREYAAKLPYLIKPILQTENQYSKYHNFRVVMAECLNAASGKYIAICEGDDYWTDPHKLQKQVNFMESNPEYTLCYTELDFYEQSTSQTIKKVFSSRHINRYQTYQDFLINKGYIAPCSWLVKKDFYAGELANPIDLTFDVALHNYANGNVGYIPECTATYRVLEHSASHLSDPRAIFIRNKGLYETQLHYINTYPEHFTVKQKYHIQSIALRGLLLSAWYFNDTALKHEIREFYSKSLKYNLLMMALDIPFIKHFIPLYRKLRLKK